MKKVNLSGKMKTLNGTVIKDPKGEISMNELVADFLVGSKGSEGAMRKMNLAQAIYNNGDLELEDADFKIVKKAVEESGASVLIVAQILKAMGIEE